MNWKTFSLVTGMLIILPLSANAARPDREADNVQEPANKTIHLARRGKHGDEEKRMTRLLQELDLTTEQSQQIETIQQQSETATKDLKEQMRSQHETMKSLLASDADTEQIREQHQAAQGVRQQLGDNRFETMLQIREVLTREQRAEMAELIEQHRDRRLER